MRWVLELQDAAVPIGNASADHFAIIENEKVYLLSSTGDRKYLPYDSVSNEFGNYWIVWRNGLKGVFHSNKGEILPVVYEHIHSAEKIESNWGYRVGKYGMTAIINDQNKLLLPYYKYGYGDLALVGDTILVYRKVKGSLPIDGHFISREGRKVPDAIVKMQLVPEFQRVSSDKYVLTNYTSGIVRNDTFEVAEKFTNNIAPVKRRGLWGFVRRDGSWLIQPKYQAAFPFDTLGAAIIKINDKYGVVSQNGELLVQPRFDFLKPVLPGHFEFKEGGKLGLVNLLGEIVLPAGNYSEFQSAGTTGFAAKSGDSLLVYGLNGQAIPLGRVIEISKKVFDETFVVLQQRTGQRDRSTGLRGVFSGEGHWVIPNVIRGRINEKKNFYFVETIVEPCCFIGDLNMGVNQEGRYLIYDRDGKPLLPFAVDNIKHETNSKLVIYQLKDKFGLVALPNIHLESEYDELRQMGEKWVFARKGSEWGVLRFEK